VVCVVVRELEATGADAGVDAQAPSSSAAIHEVRILVVCHVMAWINVPAENHPLFHAALPKDPRISTIQMFGSVAALVNGNMFGGLFARSAIAKLGPTDYPEAMALDGSEPFDPMGTGRIMSNTVLLPETILDEPGELRDWMRKAFDYAVTLPPKKKKAAKPVAKTAKAAKRTKVAKRTKAAKPKTSGKRTNR